MDLAQRLKALPLLKDFNDAQIEELISIGQTKDYPPQAIIFEEGAEADSLYLILEGSLLASKADPEGGDPINLRTMVENEFFGELALLDGGNRSATVTTLTQCRLFSIRREPFLWLVASDPVLIGSFLASVSRTARETTERLRQKELERRAVRHEIELEKHRALSQMVAGVAHELNTPLGIINSAMSIISSRLRGPEYKEAAAKNPQLREALEDTLEAVQLAETSVLRAHQLVQSFKNVSVGQVTDQHEAMNIRDAIEEVLTLFKINARKARLDIKLIDELPRDHPHLWYGYRGYLAQILLNLLTNVERYAYPQGGGKIEVVLGETQRSSIPHYVIKVRDFGVGISADDLRRVFDPFFTTGRGRGGTGLGLAIVKNLAVQGLHGDVQLESAVGVGTTVTLVTPQEISPEN